MKNIINSVSDEFGNPLMESFWMNLEIKLK